MKNVAELIGITKRYPGVVALDDIGFSIRAGEIHALAGENGAGKSTLIKILGGAVMPDKGEIVLDGEPVRLLSPHAALSRGISIVHQELVSAPDLSVTENVLLGRLPRDRFGRVRWQVARTTAREVLDRVGLDISERAGMRQLSLGQQQLVEIARALVRDAKILVLDEPSAILGGHELDTLHEVVRSLRDRGVAVVYISHRLNEVLSLSDRVSVLKDGRLQASLPVGELDIEKLVGLMTGRQLTHPERTPVSEDAPTLLEVRMPSRNQKAPGPLILNIRAGEIIGLAGLVGSGRTELARSIFGADPSSHDVTVGGRRLSSHRSPRSARRAGIAYLPEDRKDQGLFLNRSIRENVGAASLERRSFAGFLRFSKDRASVKKITDSVGLKSSSLDAPPTTLSGGNQQKVMLARWLAAGPAVLILDEPTRGIDVGGKSEIYAIMRQLTSSGRGILMISSEIEEVVAMSDRVYVMKNGQIVAEYSGDLVTEANISRSALLDGPKNTEQTL